MPAMLPAHLLSVGSGRLLTFGGKWLLLRQDLVSCLVPVSNPAALAEVHMIL